MQTFKEENLSVDNEIKIICSTRTEEIQKTLNELVTEVEQGGKDGLTYTLFLLFVGHTVIKDGMEYHVLNERDSQSNRFRSIEFAALAYDLSRMLPNMYTIIIDQSTRETFNEDKHGQILCPTPIENDELMTFRTLMDP